MNIETYDIRASDSFLAFAFVSVGIKGEIDKLVIYSLFEHIEWENVYNISFGDWDTVTGKVNFNITSANGDMEKVLATVARTVYEFINKFPYAKVFFVGSTPSRTRLYQREIIKYYDEIIKDYIILGKINEQYENFERNRNYVNFVIFKRSKKDL